MKSLTAYTLFIACSKWIQQAARHSRTVFHHPWGDSSATSGGDAARPSPTTRGAIDCGLSDVSELSEFPEGRRPYRRERRWLDALGRTTLGRHARPAQPEHQLASTVTHTPSARRALNRNSGHGGRQLRAENPGGDGSPVDSDVTMDGESAESDEAVMDVEPQPLTGTSSRMARPPRRSGMVVGLARDAYCVRGSLTLWAVRAA